MEGYPVDIVLAGVGVLQEMGVFVHVLGEKGFLGDVIRSCPLRGQGRLGGGGFLLHLGKIE